MQRSIDDIAVAGDPSDVGRAPVGVFFLDVENPLHGDVGANRIAARRVDDTLRLAGGSGGVEDVERVLGIERLGGTFVRCICHQFVPPVIAARLHIDRRAGSFIDDCVLHRRTGLQRFLNCGK